MGSIMILVSIITPIFNAEKFIKETIDSVLKQSYEHWELILIDDGSTDQTHHAIKPYLNDKRIKYLYQENQGQGKARNTGILQSTGDFIAFLDSDDLWIPEKLSLQMTIFDAHNVDLVYSNAFIIDSNGIQSEQILNSGSLAGMQHDCEILRKLIRGEIFIPILTVISKRQALISLQGFDERSDLKNAEDFDLWIRMTLQGMKFYFYDQCLSYYRVHENQSTANDSGSTPQVIRSLLNVRSKRRMLINEIDSSILDRLIILFRTKRFSTFGRDEFFNTLCYVTKSSKFFNRIIVYFFPGLLTFYCRFISKRLSSLHDGVSRNDDNI